MLFSIIIPTLNNLDYLKLCIKSLKKNSSFNHEIIVHVNVGEDLGPLRRKCLFFLRIEIVP